jgi:hypothetical protein
MTGSCLNAITEGGTVIRIVLKRPENPRPIVAQGFRAGLDAMTSAAVTIEQRNAPVKAGTLKRSIYGDFTQLDNFKARVVQDMNVAPYGPITNDGYPGIITPTKAKALKLHTKGGIIYRKSVRGQKGTHWWERIELYVDDLREAFTAGFNRIVKGG